MLRLRLDYLLLAGLLGLVLLASGNALAAGNLVAVSAAENDTLAVSKNELAPPECAGMTLTMIAWFPDTGWYYNPFSNALIVGTGGNDRLDNRSSTNNTCIVMGDGNDRVDNSGTNAVILGGNGQDTLNGSPYADKLYGGAGNDTLNGNDGDDSLYGGEGSDTLNGGPGTDTCVGGPDDDGFSACETQLP